MVALTIQTIVYFALACIAVYAENWYLHHKEMLEEKKRELAAVPVWIWMRIAASSQVTATISDIVGSSLSAGHGHAWFSGKLIFNEL